MANSLFNSLGNTKTDIFGGPSKKTVKLKSKEEVEVIEEIDLLEVVNITPW